jgi:phospholipase C
VSWVYTTIVQSEHPPAPVTFGEQVAADIVSALTSDPELWKKTALLITWDENGGFFDHVPPATPPEGTAGEYVTAPTLPDAAMGIRGPIGLGFRVPMLVVSPFARGGLFVLTASTTRRCCGCSRRASGPRCRTSRSGAATRSGT